MRFSAFFLLLLVFPAHADQFYRCKTYQGSIYWSSELCSETSALTTDIVQVPSSIPFEEQVRLADQAYAGKEADVTAVDKETIRVHECSSIDAQLDVLAAKYSHGAHVSADQFNVDQKTHRDLWTRRNTLSCTSR